MKVLIIHGGEISLPGGVYKTVRETGKHLAKNGHDVTLLQENPLNYAKEEIYNGFKVIRVKSRFSSHFYGLSPEIYWFLKKHLKDLNPDIIHIHGYHTLFTPVVLFAIRKINPEILIFFSPHLDVVKSSFAGKYLWRFYKIIGNIIFEKSSQVIACSNFEAKCIHDDYKVDYNKISILPHGVNCYNPIKNPKNNRKLNLIYAGHLIERKGVDFILESLNSLIYDLKITNVTLTIIGEGKEKKKLLKLAHNLKLDDYIIWKSFLQRDQLIREIKDADIFLLLSRSEAFGIVIAESLALGTCCIVTNNTALLEFNNEKGCFGVDYPPDPKKVANLIRNIYESDVQVGPFSDKIRTWDEAAGDYEKVYSNLLKEVSQCK